MLSYRGLEIRTRLCFVARSKMRQRVDVLAIEERLQNLTAPAAIQGAGDPAIFLADVALEFAVHRGRLSEYRQVDVDDERGITQRGLACMAGGHDVLLHARA